MRDFAELAVSGSRGFGPTLRLGDGIDVYDEIRLGRFLSKRLLDLGSYSIACIFDLMTVCPSTGQGIHMICAFKYDFKQIKMKNRWSQKGIGLGLISMPIS